MRIVIFKKSMNSLFVQKTHVVMKTFTMSTPRFRQIRRFPYPRPVDPAMINEIAAFSEWIVYINVKV